MAAVTAIVHGFHALNDIPGVIEVGVLASPAKVLAVHSPGVRVLGLLRVGHGDARCMYGQRPLKQLLRNGFLQVDSPTGNEVALLSSCAPASTCLKHAQCILNATACLGFWHQHHSGTSSPGFYTRP